MPLVVRHDLPAYRLLSAHGIQLVHDAGGQVLTIGLLNLMPDNALEATERQWMRLCGAVEDVFAMVLPFSSGEQRSSEKQAYINRFYRTPDLDSLDLLIVTGANPKTSDITAEGFWRPMMDTIERARRSGCPVVCSCLASHAVALHYYGIQRTRLPRKQWGVYQHRLTLPTHRLVTGIEEDWYGPHSHIYGVTGMQLREAGCDVLVDSDDAGFYIATSSDYPEFVFFQGHPEYDTNSLLKEFKREAGRFADGELAEFPDPPENYFASSVASVIAELTSAYRFSRGTGEAFPDFPEAQLESGLRNSWSMTGRRVFANLLRELRDA